MFATTHSLAIYRGNFSVPIQIVIFRKSVGIRIEFIIPHTHHAHFTAAKSVGRGNSYVSPAGANSRVDSEEGRAKWVARLWEVLLSETNPLEPSRKLVAKVLALVAIVVNGAGDPVDRTTSSDIATAISCLNERDKAEPGNRGREELHS